MNKEKKKCELELLIEKLRQRGLHGARDEGIAVTGQLKENLRDVEKANADAS